MEPGPLSTASGSAAPAPKAGASRRWRWLYGVAATAVLIVGALLAWPLRPLNGTERRLVGTWLILGDRPQFMRFTMDRRIRYAAGSEPFQEIGTWKAGAGGLEIRFHTEEARIAKMGWIARLEASAGRIWRRKPSVLKFHRGDRALIYGHECERVAD